MQAEESESPSPKICGCTGVRWCARCHDPGFRRRHRLDDPVPIPPLLDQRPEVDASGRFAKDDIHLFDVQRQSVPGLPTFRGLRVYNDFLSEVEASALLREINATPFQLSQSGKHKQHYGPRVNFNKQKMNAAGFRGLPDYARRIESRLRARIREDDTGTAADRSALEQALQRFQTTDVFVLRYSPREASNLDFHLDDPFAYGEVILDVSLESDSVLTFLRGRPQSEIENDVFAGSAPTCIRVPLPARSIAVLHGPARFSWEHAILAYDIEAPRTSVTLRTLSDELRESESGRLVLERSRSEAPPSTDI